MLREKKSGGGKKFQNRRKQGLEKKSKKPFHTPNQKGGGKASKKCPDSEEKLRLGELKDQAAARLP